MKKYIIFEQITKKENNTWHPETSRTLEFCSLLEGLKKFQSLSDNYTKKNYNDNKAIYLELSIQEGEGIDTRFTIVKRQEIKRDFIVVADGNQKHFDFQINAEEYFNKLDETNQFKEIAIVSYRNGACSKNRYKTIKHKGE